MKQQVVFITGATPKENYGSYYEYLEQEVDYNPYEKESLSWNKTLGDKLGEEYEYMRSPSCDLKFADYQAWKIMFKKMFPYLREDIIIATTSLGSSFILKYLGENDFPVKIKKLFFVAPALSSTREEGMGSFEFNIDLVYSRVARFTEQIYIYHSKDDPIVPFEQGLELHTYFPDAIFREFDNRGHFYKQAELPEIIEDIKN